MNVNVLLSILINKFPLENKSAQLSYFEFIEKELNDYINFIKEIDDYELESLLIGQFRQNPSKIKFINLEKFICNNLKKILTLVIKGDIYNAINRLNAFFINNSSTQYKLIEPLKNHMGLFLIDEKLYRIIPKEENTTSCNHIPFNIREKSKNVRFNLNGYPCLYLSNSVKGCIIEVEKKVNSPEYCWSEFTISNKRIPLFDLTIPQMKDISTLSVYDKFRFLLTYPLYVLCLSSSNEDFKYEYLFPQLMFHLLFIPNYNDITYDIKGIAYTSTKDSKYINYVIPALMPKTHIQTSGYSTYISELFIENFKGDLLLN